MQQTSAWAGTNRRTIAATSLVSAFTVTTGIGAGRSLTQIGGPPPLISTGGYAGDLLLVLVVLLLAAVALGVYSFAPRRRRRSDEPEDVIEREPGPWWQPWLVLLIAFAAIGGMIAALLLGLDHRVGHALAPTTPSLPTPPGHRVANPADPTHPGSFSVHWWLAALPLVLLALAAVVFRIRRHAPGPSDDACSGERDEARLAVRQLLAGVRGESDPRRAVVRAYAAMEGSLAEHGIARQRSETALEYLTRTLASLGVGGRSVRRLTALFQRAKFSPHTIDARMKHDAIDALEQLAHELGDST